MSHKGGDMKSAEKLKIILFSLSYTGCNSAFITVNAFIVICTASLNNALKLYLFIFIVGHYFKGG